MDLQGATKVPPMQAPRSRLLLSCGKSVLAVAQEAYRRVEAMRCPVGCLARGVSHMAAPILSPLQLRCLSALSFVDRQLIVVQDVTTVFFPRSERAFRKVDELVLLLESLPVRFDGAIDGLEVFVADVMSGAMGFVPKWRCRADVDFGDIRRDEEEGALHRAVVDKVRAMGKRCEDVTRKVESVEVVTVDGDGGDDDGGTGDPTEATGVGSAEKASCEDTARTLKGESNGDANPMNCDVASGAEECAEGLELERDGGAVEVVEGVETHGAATMEAMRSSEIAEVESQETAPAPHEEGRGSSEREEKAISVSGRESNVDAFFNLFDEAWQHKLA